MKSPPLVSAVWKLRRWERKPAVGANSSGRYGSWERYPEQSCRSLSEKTLGELTSTHLPGIRQQRDCLLARRPLVQERKAGPRIAFSCAQRAAREAMHSFSIPGLSALYCQPARRSGVASELGVCSSGA